MLLLALWPHVIPYFYPFHGRHGSHAVSDTTHLRIAIDRFGSGSAYQNWSWEGQDLSSSMILEIV